MGRRRRKIVKLPKKKLPKIFSCPFCGEESINIQIIKEENLAEIKCSNSECNLKTKIDISPTEEPIDIYCKFTDKVFSGSLIRE